MLASRLRLLLILVTMTLMMWFLPESPSKWPLVMIALAIPLIFGLVPRNWLYGHRTPQTMWGADETWYRHNQFTGIALLIVGLIQLYRAMN